MKPILIFLFAQCCVFAFSQTTDTLNKQSKMTPDTISFIAKMNIANATKDGIYVNGYIVHIDYDKAKKLDGMTIRVSGKINIIKGLRNMPKEYDEKGNEIIRQGREEETRHIESPIIEIIDNE